MNKAIVILRGSSSGKTQLNKIAKDNGTWVWNCSPYDAMVVIAENLGQLAEHIELAIPNFRKLYIYQTIRRFSKDKNAELLLVHGCDVELSKLIAEDFRGFTVRSLFIENDEDAKTPVLWFDKTILFDENFDRNVVEFLASLNIGMKRSD